ncbi:Sensor kinase CckA [bioreactor metagenome]|uniref:Sensor kinase CckA n=1 Tax=bioreactor metagenome TaxID=1076179 RepID=A0A644VAI3_9ZZZZ
MLHAGRGGGEPIGIAMDNRPVRPGLSVPLEEALNELEEGFAVFDAEFRLLAWNRRFLELHDLPAALAFPGAEYESFVRCFAERGDYGPGDAAALVRGRMTGARRAERIEIELAKPMDRVIEAVGRPLASGGYLSTCADVTARRNRAVQLEAQVEERTRALRLSEERLALIADEVPAGIAHFDSELHILYANRRFARAYRRSPAEMIGLHATEVLSSRTLGESERYFEQARRGALVDFEMRVELPDGRFKDIRTLLRPERPSSGEVIGFYLLSIDVTRRKAAMAALMGAQKMDALGRMASGISHDFNNLLTVILGNLLPLSEEIGEGELNREFLAPAIAAARRGSALTQRLLTLARREQFAPEPTDIPGAVAEICTLLRASMPRKLVIGTESAAELPPALVDRSQLEMALLNLAMNARDATGGAGQIRIEIAPYDLPPQEADLLYLPAGRYVRLRFSDDGCGMSPEQVERIFEPFFTSKAAGAGSGLGLSMVYGFVKQSNGAIMVESAPGAGSCFTILLPSVGLAALPPAPLALPAPEPAPEEESPPLLLLVEDDRDVRRTLRRKIAALGHPLIEADSADEAKLLIQRIGAIAVVISDIDMPGTLDGFGLARWLASERPGTGVVLMSGKAGLAGQAAAELPGLPILRKPFTDAALAAALATAQALAPQPARRD